MTEKSEVYRRLQPYLATLRTSPDIRAAFAFDDDDVRAECAIKAMHAAEVFAGDDPTERVKYAHRAAKNRLRDIIRASKAAWRQAGSPDAIGHLTAVGAGLGYLDPGMREPSPTPEESSLRAVDQRSYVAAVAHLRRAMSHESLDLISARADGEPYERSKARALEARHRRSRALARRILKAPTFKELTAAYPQEQESVPIPISELSTEDLARFALANGVSVDRLDHDSLVNEVSKLSRDDAGAELPIPSCFGDEYDAGDPDCAEECGFAAECAVCAKSPAVEKIEARVAELVKLNLRERVGMDETPQPELPAPQVEPATPPPTPPVEPPKAKPPLKKPPKKAAKGEAEPEKSAKPPKKPPLKKPPKKAAAKKPPKKARPAAPKKAALPPPPKKPRRQKVEPAKASKVMRAHGDDPADPRYAPLSDRRGVVRAGQKGYRLKPDGTRWLRLPQGSAAELAQLPVKTKLYRLYRKPGEQSRYLYVIQKIEDGIVSTTPSGKERKRDGRWRLVAIYPESQVKNKRPIPKAVQIPSTNPRAKLIGSEGTANALVALIVGSKTWSGAKFFGVLPPALDPNSPGFDPRSANPESVYSYRK